TQCPAVSTMSPASLVTELPEHASRAPLESLKKTRPTVLDTPTAARPCDGGSSGGTYAAGCTGFEAAFSCSGEGIRPGATEPSSDFADFIRSWVQNFSA